MRLQSALSLREFAGLEEFGRRVDRGRRKKHRRKRRRRRRRRKADRREKPRMVRARTPADTRERPPEVIEARYIEPQPRRGVHPWSPAVQMGPNLRIQAASGHRAAVIELKPGLFIVAEVPEHVTRPEFGVLPLLAPLVVSAATKAIANPKPMKDRLLPKLVSAAVQKARQPEAAPAAEATALVRARPAHPELLPAAGSGSSHGALMPAPALGRWVDDDDLADLVGCDLCSGRCGR